MGRAKKERNIGRDKRLAEDRIVATNRSRRTEIESEREQVLVGFREKMEKLPSNVEEILEKIDNALEYVMSDQVSIYGVEPGEKAEEINENFVSVSKALDDFTEYLQGLYRGYLHAETYYRDDDYIKESLGLIRQEIKKIDQDNLIGLHNRGRDPGEPKFEADTPFKTLKKSAASLHFKIQIILG